MGECVMKSRTATKWHIIVVFGVMAVLASVCPTADGSGESPVLYNGIVTEGSWPPANRPLSREPMAVPYLEAPPDVIPIDVGRQLFIDDFLIGETNLRRVLHRADYYPQNPILIPDKPWEMENASGKHAATSAMPFSDGVWFDPQDNLFKMWYMGGYVKATCYAVSRDGIAWDKPELDVIPGTNIVQALERDSSTVWLDLKESDPQRRFKLFIYLRPGRQCLNLYFSPDGIHWTDSGVTSGTTGDRSTVFYNPFREVWVYGIRDYEQASIGRYRRYWEHKDALAGARWEEGQPPFWVGADVLDAPRQDLGTPCELYNLDAVAYESVLLGLFDIWRGQPDDRAKPNELCIGFSRDGFHWSRPSHEPFIPVSETVGEWNWANVQSAGGCCLVVGDQLYFYVSGRKGEPGSSASGVCSTGLATLRRDGFASMEAGAEPGTLTTRPVRFSGKYLFVNAATKGGTLRVEVLDEDGTVIAPYAVESCAPISLDSTCERVMWQDAADLDALADRPVRFRFHLRDGALFAFWVSPSPSGASNGHVAAGGPGFTGPTDTVGKNKDL